MPTMPITPMTDETRRALFSFMAREPADVCYLSDLELARAAIDASRLPRLGPARTLTRFMAELARRRLAILPGVDGMLYLVTMQAPPPRYFGPVDPMMFVPSSSDGVTRIRSDHRGAWDGPAEPFRPCGDCAHSDICEESGTCHYAND